jgi:PhnB protein
MKSINPYLNFKGNAEEAFQFYKTIFGTNITGLQRYGETPGVSDMSPSDREKVMHIAMPLGKGSILMASDAIGEENKTLNVGNNISLNIEVESQEEADRIFNGLTAGGKIDMPMQKTFWNAYFGMCTDKYGIHWMIDYDLKTRT